MERYDELTAPPVVGRYYWVPTVYGRWYNETLNWPVWGPKHDDAKHLRFPQRHYHLNRLFLAEHRVEHAVSAPLGEMMDDGRGFIENDPLRAPVMRKLQCRRSEHRFPIKYALSLTENIWRRFVASFEGQQARRDELGWVCPHKGMRLASMKPDADGCIQCPLHGLRINANTGIVMGATR